MRAICIFTAIALSGCSAMPLTTAAFNQSGVGAAIDTFLGETAKRVVMVCTTLDGSRLSTVLDVGAGVAGLSGLLDDTRDARRSACAAAGGAMTEDVQG